MPRRTTPPGERPPLTAHGGATHAAGVSRAGRAVRALLSLVVAPIVLGALIVIVFATTPWGNERVRRLLVSQANERLAGQLAIGSLRGNLFRNATLTGVRVLDSSRAPVLTVARMRVAYAVWPALHGQVVIQSLELDSALLVMDQRPGARWNFQTIVRSSGAPTDTSVHRAPPEIANVVIRQGELRYRRPWHPDTTLSAAAQAAAVDGALAPTARIRTERVAGGYQRVLDYRRIDAALPVVQLAHGGRPMVVRIAALAMLAEPYRPPAIAVRSLTGTLYASRDSLWWHGAHLTLPGSQLTGDGKIGFAKAGLSLDLTGAPVSLADLRWLRPSLPAEGGGHLRVTVRLRGDTSELALSDADLRYRDARLVGGAAVTRVAPAHATATTLVRGVELTVARLSTSLLHELLPSARLPRSGILNGHLAAHGAPNDLQVDADVRFADARAGESRLVARGGVGVADRAHGGVHANALHVELRPLQLATLAGSGARMPVGGTLAGIATLSGSVGDGWQVRGDLTHAEGGERSRVTGTGSYRTAGGRIVADATLQPLSLVTLGRLAPGAALRGAVTGRVHAEGTGRALVVRGSLRSTNGGGAVAGQATLAHAGGRTRYDVAVAVDALDARAFSRRAPATSLTGRVSARGVGFSAGGADARFAADLGRSRYDTFAVDRLLARGAVARGVLRLDTLAVAAAGAHAQASGTLGLVAARSGALQIALTLDSLGALRRWLGSPDTTLVAASASRQAMELSRARADSARRADAVRIERLALGLPEGVALVVDTLPGIRRDSLAGSLALRGTLRGSIVSPALDARVTGRALVARGSAVGALDAAVHGEALRSPRRLLHVRVQADAIRAAGYDFEHLDAAGAYQDQQLIAHAELRQDAAVSYAAAGRWRHGMGGAEDVALDSLRARFDTLNWRLAHPTRIRVAHGDVTVDSLELRSSAGGRLFANGSVPAAGPMHLEVAAEQVHVATVLRALQRDATGDARVGAVVQLDGSRADPTMRGTVAIRDGTYRGTRAPDADLTLRYAARRLAASATARDSVGRRVLAATASLPVDLALVSVRGSRRTAGELVADAVLDSLALGMLPLSSSSLEALQGTVAGEAHVRGTWAMPSYSGHAALRDGGVVVASTGMRVTGAVADLRVAGDTLRLDSLVARAGGALRAAGTVDLSDRTHPVLHLAASGRNLRVLDATRGLVDVDGEIRAEGPLAAVRVTGRGEMLHGYLALKQFNKKLLRVKAPDALSLFSVYDTTRPPEDVRRARAAQAGAHRVGAIVDLSLVVDRGSYYRNRPDANTEFYTGAGEQLEAHLDTRAGDAWAVGFVRIGEGVAFFRAAPFEPARGTLTFQPWTGSAALLEQVGERPVWEPGRGFFPVELLTGGTSKAPALALESGTLFPIRGRELNGYLTIGRERLSLLQQSGSSLSGSEAWSGQLSGETGALARRQQAATALGVVLHDIGTGATKEFGLDAFSVSPADVPTELVFGKTGGVRGAMIEAGRYVTTDRYIVAEMRLTTGIPGLRVQQRVGTQYRLDAGLTPRFLFGSPAELGITHPTVRTGAFGAYLTRGWDW